MKVPEWLTLKAVATLVIVAITAAVLMSALPLKKQSEVVKALKKEGFDKVVLDTSKEINMYPYTTEPINSLDQYELQAVFENEGDRELKQTQINQIARRYPLDWSLLPPSSSRFQSEQQKYIEGFSTKAAADSPGLGDPYRDIGDGNLTPPDTLALEHEEKKILAAYAPAKAQDLTTYDLTDARQLINKLYAKQGKVAEVVEKDNNVFEIVRTRNAHEKIEYEDDLPDAPASSGPVGSVGEATIQVPPVASEVAAGRDPFYEPTTATRSDRSDYTKWTPGLERMFAPTYPTTDWIGQPRDTVAAQGAHRA